MIVLKWIVCQYDAKVNLGNDYETKGGDPLYCNMYTFIKSPRQGENT